MRQQACPLCGNDAPFNFTANPQGKYFCCPHCSEFWIDSHCEIYLADLPEITRTGVRKKLSEYAQRVVSGHLFVIREPKPEEIHGNGHGVAREILKSEWIERAGLLP